MTLKPKLEATKMEKKIAHVVALRPIKSQEVQTPPDRHPAFVVIDDALFVLRQIIAGVALLASVLAVMLVLDGSFGAAPAQEIATEVVEKTSGMPPVVGFILIGFVILAIASAVLVLRVVSQLGKPGRGQGK